MSRSRTLSQPAPGPVLWLVAGLLSVLSLVPTAGPLSPLGGLTTALRVVPVLWYLPAAVVMLRSRS